MLRRERNVDGLASEDACVQVLRAARHVAGEAVPDDDVRVERSSGVLGLGEVEVIELESDG